MSPILSDAPPQLRGIAIAENESDKKVHLGNILKLFRAKKIDIFNDVSL